MCNLKTNTYGLEQVADLIEVEATKLLSLYQFGTNIPSKTLCCDLRELEKVPIIIFSDFELREV